MIKKDDVSIAEFEHDIFCAVRDEKGSPLWVLKKNGDIIICEQSIKDASIQLEQIRA